MEINAEISTEDYTEVIRSYYLGKDWVKYIAILALIALGLAFLGVISYGYKWRVLYGFFDVYFLLLFLFFFALPYGIYYLRMRKAISLIVCQPVEWAFNISETGMYTKNDDMVRYYPWTMVEKILMGGEYVVFKPAVGQVFCLPSALLDENSKIILANVNAYLRKPAKERITPST